MKTRKYRYFVADFETTVYGGQENTEVWASAIVELGTEEVHIFHSIEETFEFILSLNSHCIIYYHNLKFDGSFWLDHLITKLKMKQAYTELNEKGTEVEWLSIKDMTNNSFRYTISEMGQWYTIVMKVNNHVIELRDSLKLLPFSVKEIGKAFNTKHQKLDMEYTGYRYAGCTITDEEKQYIANDVLVVKEALEIMFSQGHDKLTIGSCCLHEYKSEIGKTDWEEMFPDLTAIPINVDTFGSKNADEYIRKSYRGGWCYLVKGKENQIKRNGTTADVNSLYPSMMSSESGNFYPIGQPHFWQGEIPDKAKRNFYFVRFTCRFKIKQDMLPFIQLKCSLRFDPTEMLTTSDYWDKERQMYFRYYKDLHGNICDTIVTMTMTMMDFKLLQEHYDIFDLKILDGCWFYQQKGIFDFYINKYKEMKLKSKGALRTLAKLFLNNLYGKMASSTDSSFKVAYEKEDGAIGFFPCRENKKQAGFIAVGSAITSYARNFTIRSAQQNYYGVDKRGFIYADTDSIHCDLSPDEIKGITVHDKNFCCWKLESSWDIGWFVRQKTYIEHVTAEDLQPIDKPYYNVKCAGMPQKCKDLFISSLLGETLLDKDSLSEEEKDFLINQDGSIKRRTLEDFKIGLSIPGKLRPKRIKGGILLVDTSYEMR